jgi:hypothetical protein
MDALADLTELGPPPDGGDEGAANRETYGKWPEASDTVVPETQSRGYFGSVLVTRCITVAARFE